MRLFEALKSRGALSRGSRVSDRDYFPLDGGLDTENSPLSVTPGSLIGSKNYEPGRLGGLRRVGGFEPFDGRASTETASYVYIEFDAGVVDEYPVVGDTINGETSGATGVVLAIGQRDSFSSGFVGSAFGPPDTVGYVALVGVSGTFVDDENLRISTTVFAVADGGPQSYAPTDDLSETLLLAAEDLIREDIEAVPGSGPIRGVWFFGGAVYAFRDNVGATACVMHKSSGSGWAAVTLNRKIRFDGGTTEEFVEGDTVTGATSGASGVVRRVGYNGGILASHTATGYIVFQSVTGAFTDGENLRVGVHTRAVANGADFVQTLVPGGRYEFRSNNFFGHSSKYRFYGVDGKNPAFEYDPDDSTFCQIDTGMTTDTPIHIGVYLDYLVLGFPGGSTQLSGQNEPHSFLVVLGAGELALGEEVTGYLEEIGSDSSLSLFVMGRSRIYRLTGRTSEDFVLVPFKDRVGSREWSIQRLSDGIFLDDQGYTTLTASDAYGNFSEAVISDEASKKISSLLESSSVVDSHVSRTHSVYRCSFSSGDNIVIGSKIARTSGGGTKKVYRLTVTNYGVPVRCSCEEEDTDGRLRTFFGSDDGWVYEHRDEYTSFAGETIESFWRTHFHFSKTPQRIKQYRYAFLDVKSDDRKIESKYLVDYSSGDPSRNFEPQKSVSVSGGGGFWDINNWAEFQWSSRINPQVGIKLNGAGTNISMAVYSNVRGRKSHTFHGITYHHSMRRINRETSA